MKKLILAILVFVTYHSSSLAQGGFAWGVKGGLSMAFQKWDYSDRDPLFGGHGMLFIETLADDGEFALFVQGGYHTRGSSIITRGFNYTDPTTGASRRFSGNTTRYDFQNLAVSAGVKQRFPTGFGNMYYLFGLRGDYNLKNSFSQYKDLPENLQAYFPSEVGVRDFTFGFIFGGGLEFQLSDYIDATVELTINPDYTKQYYQPAGTVYDPYTRSTRTIQERNIKNNTFELTVGFRFLRLVEYID